MTEMGTVIGVRNAAIVVAVVGTVVSNGLWLIPSGLPRLLCALRLLALLLLGALRLRLLCTLLRLGFLRALLRLRFLCVLLRLGFLRVLLWLRFLRVLLRLGLLRVLLRLRLVLRRLGFCSASALFLLAFFC